MSASIVVGRPGRRTWTEKFECPWHAWQFILKIVCLTVNPREKVPT